MKARSKAGVLGRKEAASEVYFQVMNGEPMVESLGFR